MRLPMRAAIFFAALSPLAAAGGQAQRDTSPIPRGLVNAVLYHYADRYGGTAEPEIIVNAVPDRLAGKFGVPPGGAILGTVDLRTSTIVIGTAPGNEPTLFQWLVGDFQARGYRPAVPFHEANGFVSPSVAPVTAWCDGRRELSIRTRNSRGLSTATFEITIEEGGYQCQPPGRIDPNLVVGRRNLPLLVNPGGVQPGALCQAETDLRMRGGLNENTADAAYRTSLTPAQLLAHYGRQLDSAGWKREPSLPAAWGTWRRPDSAGSTKVAALLVTALSDPPTCRHATIQIFRKER